MAATWSNEELAERIKAGENELLPILWGQIRNLIAMLAARYYMTAQQKYSAFVDNEDFIQCGYFAMIEALNAYDPAKQFRFTSYLKYRYTDCVNKMLGIRRVRSDRGRIWELPPDPVSLNKETKQGEGDELEEFVSDDSSDPEKIIEQRELSKLITAALEDLSQKQRAIIQGVYFEEKSTAQLAEELGLTDAQQAFRVKNKALNVLSKNEPLRRYYYSNFDDPPEIPSYESTTPERALAAEEQLNEWKRRYIKELEGITGGLL